MRKIIKIDELPKGFFYFSDTHIVQGTGNNIKEKEKEHERVYSEKR